LVVLGGVSTIGGAARTTDPTVFTAWRTYRAQAGDLPDDRIRALHVDGDRLWVGTMNGVALYADGRWQTWTGMGKSSRVIVRSIDVEPQTGNVWMGTWGDGLYRFSGGRFDRFDQINSGLAGNLVFSVVYFHNAVWAATNAGVSVFDARR